MKRCEKTSFARVEFENQSFVGLVVSSLTFKHIVFTQTSKSHAFVPQSLPDELFIKLEKKENYLVIEYNLDKYEELCLSFQILMKKQLCLQFTETVNYEIANNALDYKFCDLSQNHDEFVMMLEHKRKLKPDTTEIATNNTGLVQLESEETIFTNRRSQDIVSITKILNDMTKQMKILEIRVKSTKSMYRGQLAMESQFATDDHNQQIIRLIIQFINYCKSFFQRVFPDFSIKHLDDFESALCGAMKHFPTDCDLLALMDRSIRIIVDIIQKIQIEYNLHQLTYVDEKSQARPRNDINDYADGKRQRKTNSAIKNNNHLLDNKGHNWLKFNVDMATNPTFSGGQKLVTAIIDTGARDTRIPVSKAEFSYFTSGRKITEKFIGVGGKYAETHPYYVSLKTKLEGSQNTTISFDEAVIDLNRARNFILIGRKDLTKFGFFCDFGFDIFGFKSLGDGRITATFPINKESKFSEDPPTKRRNSI